MSLGFSPPPIQHRDALAAETTEEEAHLEHDVLSPALAKVLVSLSRKPTSRRGFSMPV